MSLFDHLTWRGDHFELGGRTFRLQHQATQQTADDAFMFYKDRGQLEQFDRFLTETGFAPKRVLELGIWDGGSVVFWTELLGLERYAAIDLQLRGDSEYFTAWQRERGGGRVSTHWGVSQTDGEQKGLPPQLRHQRRPHSRTCPVARALQHSTSPQRTRSKATNQPAATNLMAQYN